MFGKGSPDWFVSMFVLVVVRGRGRGSRLINENRASCPA